MVTGFDGMLMQIEQIRSLGMDSSIGTGVGISESMVDMLVLFRLHSIDSCLKACVCVWSLLIRGYLLGTTSGT